MDKVPGVYAVAGSEFENTTRIGMAVRKGDGRMMFNPTADTTVEGGDHLIVMGRQENLDTLEALLAVPRHTP